MVEKLHMKFSEDNLPDFGTIRFDKEGKYLHLLTKDVDKLNSTLTRAACVGEYNADQFAFQSGDAAFADDTQRAFVYNTDSDSWHEWEI